MSRPEKPQLMLTEMPDDLLLLILAALPRPHAAAPTCKRLCRLVRSTVRYCSVVCTGVSNPRQIFQTLAQLPQLACLRLQAVRAWIDNDPAALEDLLGARQDARSRPGTLLWLAFCDRSFKRIRAHGGQQHTHALARNCDLPLLRDWAACTRYTMATSIDFQRWVSSGACMHRADLHLL